jgi:hypothetical protein
MLWARWEFGVLEGFLDFWKGRVSSWVRAVPGSGHATSQWRYFRVDEARIGWKIICSSGKVGHFSVWTILNRSSCRSDASILEMTSSDSIFCSIKTSVLRERDSGRDVYCERPASVTPDRFSNLNDSKGGRHINVLLSKESLLKEVMQRLRNEGRRLNMRREMLGSSVPFPFSP